MMDALEKRNLFFKYLEEIGLDPKQNHSILEVAPSIGTSQSLLLVEKYGDLYKQFLVASNLKQRDFKSSSIKGIVGEVTLKNNLAVPLPIKSKITSYLRILRYGQFDTLLIQGQLDTAYRLTDARQQILFGDVCKKDDTETRGKYLFLFNTVFVRNKYGYYKCYHDVDGNDEYYLIKRKK